MKRLITIFLMTVFGGILLTTAPVKASHMMGADISWKCNGDTSFTITLTTYRDCNGIQVYALPFTLTPKGGCPGATITTATGSMTNGKDVTPVCKSSCTRCSSPSCSFPFGIQEWEETQTVHFPPTACCKYEISWDECCRNGALTTINPDDFYINALLNRCDTPCDNSPYFTNPPLAIICVNQCFMFNQGVNDVNVDSRGNADSLVYSLTPPLDYGGAAYSYNSPYSYKEPLKYSGAFGNPTGGKWDPAHKICNGFHLDSVTGDLYFKPVKTDVTVIAIQIQEWKKDALGNPYLSSTIRRDVQVAVITCPANHVPTLTGINGTSSTDIDYCVDQYKCFKIISYDQDEPDTVTLTWNQAIPGATFTANNKVTKHPVGTFCWEPTQARSYPYYFVANAQDNACPVNGRTSRSYAIHVHPRPEANYSATVAACGLVTFRASPKVGLNIPGISQYRWSGPGSPPLYSLNDSFTHKYRLSGTYPYSLTLTSNNGCVYTYNDSVIIPKYVEVFLPGDTTVCTNTNMTIQSSIKLNTGAVSYKWNVNKVNLASTASSINYTFTQAGDTVPVVVTVTDQATGCSNYDSMKVYVTRPPAPSLPADIYACSGSSVMLNDTITKSATHTWQQFINGNWQTLQTVSSDSSPVGDSGLYRVEVNYTGVQNCAGIADVHVQYNPLLDVNPDSEAVCAGDNVTLRAGDGDSVNTVWNWYDVTHGHVDARHTRYITVHPGTLGAFYKVTAIQTENGITCIASGIIQAYPVPQPTMTPGKITPQCINNPVILLDNYMNINTYGDGEKSRTWSSVTSILSSQAVNGNTFNPAVSQQGDFWLRCMVVTKSGCSKTDSVSVHVDSLPKISAGPNDTICTSDGAFLLGGSPAGGKWTVTGTKALGHDNSTPPKYYFYPSQSGQGQWYLKYSYTSASASKCEAVDSISMTVYQTPSVHINPPGSLCKGDAPAQIIGTPSSGIWTCPSAPGALSSSGLFDPSLVAAGTYQIYYSYGINGHCTQTDSNYITVNAIPVFSNMPSNNTYCINDPDQVLSATPSGGVWKGPGMNGNYFRPSVAYNTGAGPYTETYYYTDPKTGCSNTYPVIFTVNNHPHLTMKTKPVMCEGDANFLLSATISNASGIQWDRYDPLSSAWTTAGITSPNDTITGFQPSAADIATHYVLVEAQPLPLSGNSCDTLPTQLKIQISSVKANFSASPLSGCGPLTVHMIDSSRSAEKYYWYFGDGDSEVNNSGAPKPHIYKNAGSYTIILKVMSVDSCIDIYSGATITVFPSPVAVIYAKPIMTPISLPNVKLEGDQSLYTDASSKYLWHFGDGSMPSTDINTEHEYKDTGQFMVTLFIKNVNGCFDSIRQEITILPELLVYIPDAFTPNGIGPVKNEVFNVVAQDFSSYDLKVYSRWGELLYESQDISKGWDGRYRGQMSQDDVYVYVVKIIANSGRKYSYTGTVTLLK